MNGCSTPWKAFSIRDRGLAVWKVATIGPSATINARNDRLGATGSCTCSTSNRPARIQRRTLVYDIGPNDSRATEPLYGIGTLRPDGTTKSGKSVEPSESSPGASTETW